MFAALIPVVLTLSFLTSMPDAHAQSASETVKLNLIVTNIRSAEGEVAIAVFNDPSTFPKEPGKALVTSKVKAQSGQISLEGLILPPGKYAVSVFHDEDQNGEMKFGLFGIPREGFGFSQNKRVYFDPPSFSKAEIIVSGPTTDCEIKMKYF